MRVVSLAIAVCIIHAVMNAVTAGQVDPTIREASLLFYHQEYVPTSNVPVGWTGSHATCTAGTTSSAFRDALMGRINYFRAMAGMPAEVVQNAVWNAKAQQAALNDEFEQSAQPFSSLDLELLHGGGRGGGGKVEFGDWVSGHERHRRVHEGLRTCQRPGGTPAVDLVSAVDADGDRRRAKRERLHHRERIMGGRQLRVSRPRPTTCASHLLRGRHPGMCRTR